MSCAITPEQDPELTEVCGQEAPKTWKKPMCEMHYSRFRRSGTYENTLKKCKCGNCTKCNTRKQDKADKAKTLREKFEELMSISRLVFDKYPLETLVL